MTAFASCRQRPEVAVETLILIAALVLILGNLAFWRGALAGRSIAEWWTWRFLAATYAGLVALHFGALCLIATRHTVRPLLSVLIAIGGMSGYFMHRYGVVLDTQMVRNVLHTDWREAAELFGGDTLCAMLLVLAAAAAPWCFRLRQRVLPLALAIRSTALVASLVIGVAAVGIAFQDLSSVLRNHRGLGHALTPANVLWGFGQVIVQEARGSTVPRAPAEPVERVLAAANRKPVLFVMVVGETARAANFALNGYARPTNPELAKLDVINFAHASACGTSTEVSLPCMFSPLGRAGYDANSVRRHESLLQLLARAGLSVVWVDNQSGCKNVCDGIDFRDVSHQQIPGLCSGDNCYDEVLLQSLPSIAADSTADTVVILHQMGNHGPAYFRRYPPELTRFAPACERQELRRCSREEIVNAYDNAIAYTDGFLAATIRFLDGVRSRFNVALLYVSDHGESLGELGLYLHGMPFAIAPREQIEVPMLLWIPADAARALDIDATCLRARALRAASHDNIYHSLLGLLAVRTQRYRSELDVFDGCRGAKTQAGGRQLATLDGQRSAQRAIETQPRSLDRPSGTGLARGARASFATGEFHPRSLSRFFDGATVRLMDEEPHAGAATDARDVSPAPKP